MEILEEIALSKDFAKFRTPMLIIILLIAFAVRVFRLDAQSLWWDEGISLHLATSSVGEIWADRAQRLHPPGYFILLKGWLSLVGVSAFTGRYLSVLASWVQVTAVYITCRYWFAKLPQGKWIIGLTTLLITLSPLSIIYGQETRVYALLPLVYLTMLLAATKIGNKFAHSDRSGGFSRNGLHDPAKAPTPDLYWRWWVVLGVSEWVGVHLHYITFLLVAIVNVWLLWHIYQRNKMLWWRWLMTQAVVVLASLPWFVSVLFNFIAVRKRVDTGRFLTEPAPFDYLVQQIWTFHFTGLAGSLARDNVRILALLTAAAFVGLMIWHLVKTTSRSHYYRLLLVWLLPLAFSFFIWSVRSFSHPRYISIYAVGVFPLVAYFVVGGVRLSSWRWFVYNVLAVGLIGCVLALSYFSLEDYFFDQSVAKDDIRGVAAYLEAEAGAGDLILVPDEDWSLAFEYDGDAAIEMPGTKQRESMWEHLAEITAVPRQIFVLEYKRGAHDWQNVVPFVLERAGYLEIVESIDDMRVRRFQLHEPVAPVNLTPVVAQFESLALTDVWVEEGAAADTAVTVALRWRLDALTPDPLGVSLQLQDVGGWSLAWKDEEIVDENGRPPSFWPVGATTTTYHIIPLPEGIPPLDYQVSVSVFQQNLGAGPRTLDLSNQAGQRFTAAETSLIQEIGVNSNPYDLLALSVNPSNVLQDQGFVQMGDGLLLQAATVDRNNVAPGQSVFVQLQWQASDIPLQMPLALDLVQGDISLSPQVDMPVLGRYPPHLWQPGEVVLEHRRLVVPPGAEGDVDVVVMGGETAVIIGQL
ncbi:MAG: hypothetical protein DWQ04_27425, partial [Chloroflexi bacterium]